MLSMLLVEDEIIELKLLREHIDWNSMGIQIVGTARNGRSAWEQIHTLQPDIVLTDVRMPIMDGLQLVSLIKDKYDWIQIIFLSGHDEFTYVKSALTAGAVDYLLKPIDLIELSTVMDKVKEEVEKARLLRNTVQIMIDKQIADILRGCGNESGQLAWTELLRIAPAYRGIPFIGAIIEIDESSQLSARTVAQLKTQDRISQSIRSLIHKYRLKGAFIRLDAYRWFLIIQAEDDGPDRQVFWDALLTYAQSEEAWTATIGISRTQTALDHVDVLYREAEQAIEERFYTKVGQLHTFSLTRVSYAGQALSDMDFAGAEKLDLYSINQEFERVRDYFAQMKQQRLSREQVYTLMTTWLNRVSEEWTRYEDRPSTELGELEDWCQVIRNMDTLSSIEAYTIDLLRKIEQYMEGKRQDPHLQLVQQIVDYIEAEYAEPLTIEYLSSKVYLSPNYLRALFKEKRGCTVHEYLTQVRMRKAIELLRDRTLRVHDVAHRTGYDNTSYFCTIFDKYQGVTPNEYRKRFL